MAREGLATNKDRGARIGVEQSTVSRIQRGKTLPGVDFIAAALAAFPRLTFEDLFEVRVPGASRARKGAA